MNLLDLAVKITCDDQASDKVDGIGSKIKSGLGNAAKAAGAVVAAATATAAAGVIAITKQATDAYANYEQLVGGVQKLFEGSANTVISNAEAAYKTAGMSANDYMETVTSFSASLLSSLGGDTEAAASYADQAVRDMSDNANTFGTDIQSIQDAYQGFAKQNYTMLDNLKLGYGGTKEEMERLIGDANKVKEANGEMADLSIESFADIVEAIHIMQEEMNIAGTTEREAMQTIEGSVNSAKAAWTNWLTALGDENADLGEKTQIMVDSVVTAAENIVPRVMQILQSLGSSIGEYLPQIIQMFVEMGTGLAETAVPIIMQFVTALIEALPQLMVAGIQIIMTLVQAIAENAPMLVDAIVGALTSMINTISEWLPTLVEATITIIQAVLAALIDNLPQILDSVVNLLVTVIGTLVQYSPQILAMIVQLLVQLLAKIGEYLGNILSNVGSWILEMVANAGKVGSEFLAKVVEFFSQLPGRIAEFLANIISNIVGWVSDMVGKAMEMGSDFLQAVSDKFWEVVNFFTELPGRIIGAIGNAGSMLLDVGGQIIQGLINGITGAIGGAINAVGNAIGSVIDGAKSMLGIASPSKVFKQIGDFTMQGLEEGIEKSADAPIKAMQDAIDSVSASAEIETNVSTNSDINTPIGRSIVFNVTVNNDGEARNAGKTIGEALYEEYARIERSRLYA